MKDKRAARTFPSRSPIHKTKPGALLWPRDLLGRCARVTVVGSERALVENHTGLIELTETRIRLGTGCGPITVTGEALTLCEARPRAMIVQGRIASIELPREGGEPLP